ncbi:hypothetical protein SLS62_004820 [Diatrype stigma]|uniref:Uncharacterized protein n=1 Tax=Diatrype stigma TaxID=117547 RepID=A0AAN9UTV1_9PEZI
MAEDMSIAIELKFLIPFLPHGHAGEKQTPGPPIKEVAYIQDARDIHDASRLKLWKDAFYSVASTIKGVAGQDAITSYELEDRGAQEWEFWATTWIVKDSKSAEPSKEDPDSHRFIWVPVEINSPKMAWRHPGTLRLIEIVLKALRGAHHIVSNHSCEVHVHVGRLDGRAFSLPSMKRMAILMWMAEPIMRKVKDPRSPNYDHTYTWSFAQRDHSRLAKWIREDKTPQARTRRELEGLDPALVGYVISKKAMFPEYQKAIGHIWRAHTYVELGKMMSGDDKPHRRLGFNFSAMGEEDERARRSPKTIECRFLEGIIEEDVIIGWIRIFGTMVQAALNRQETQGRFAKTVLRLVDEDDQPPFAEAFHRLAEDLGIDKEISKPIEVLIRRIHGEGA